MNNFFTSDNHFNHSNIIKYSNRPFNDIQEMNETLIKRWNDKVTNNDIVYNLGDFHLGKNQNIPEIISRLKFKKLIFIKGNHDKSLMEFYKNYKKSSLKDIEVHNFLEIKIDKQDITLCHFPMRSWNKSHYGSWNLFGHHHGTLKETLQNQLDVGVDCWNFYPLEFEEVKMNIIQS